MNVGVGRAYNVSKLHWPRSVYMYVGRFLSWYCRYDQTIVELYICDSAVFWALHDQLELAWHVQLTRCFSAVA